MGTSEFLLVTACCAGNLPWLVFWIGSFVCEHADPEKKKIDRKEQAKALWAAGEDACVPHWRSVLRR